MKDKIECPFCDGTAELLFKKEKRTFRKEEFEIFSHFYKCGKCREEFTTTQTDDLNTKQVYNRYREKHNIPLAGQMKYLRERYGLPAAKMSKILGFGPNQYSLYEKGDIPNESNSQLIDIVTNPKTFKDHLLKRESFFTPNEFKKTITHMDKLIAEEKESKHCIELKLFNPFDKASEKNGYQMPSFEKFVNMVIYFLNAAPQRTRLNKFLFYADFLNFKNTGSSITGCNYAAIDFGPVPHEWRWIYNSLENDGCISTEPYYKDGEEQERFITQKNFNESLFSDQELESMKTVKDRFENLNTTRVKDLSHKELGWLENIEKKALISYQKYGFLLKAF
jgi:putative zinc finger/helix-turn-helix YgiT family protein